MAIFDGFRLYKANLYSKLNSNPKIMNLLTKNYVPKITDHENNKQSILNWIKKAVFWLFLANLDCF